MPHNRTKIRGRVKTMLAGSPDAGARVLPRRSLPLPKDLAPTFIFAIQSERSTDVSMDGTQERVAELRVTACAKGDAEATEDVLDRMGLYAEQRFAGDPTLGGLIETYVYQSAEFSFAGDGDQTICTAAYTFALTYYAKRGDPQTSL